MPRKKGSRKASKVDDAVEEEMEAGIEGESPAAASASFTSDADDVMDTSVTSVSEDQGEKAVDDNEASEPTDENKENTASVAHPEVSNEQAEKVPEAQSQPKVEDLTDSDKPINEGVNTTDANDDSKVSSNEKKAENGTLEAMDTDSKDVVKTGESESGETTKKDEAKKDEAKKENDAAAAAKEEEEEEEEDVIEVESDPGSDLEEGDTHISDAEFMVFNLPDEQTVVGELTEMISRRKVLVYPLFITEMSHPSLLNAITQCSEFRTNFAESRRPVVSPVSGGTATVDPPPQSSSPALGDTGTSAAAPAVAATPAEIGKAETTPATEATAPGATDAAAPTGAVHWVGLVELSFKSTFAAVDSVDALRQIREDITVRSPEPNESKKKKVPTATLR